MKLDNLRTIRMEKKLTRKQLSELSGVPIATIESLEMGKVNVHQTKLGTLVKLAKALKTKVVHLVPQDIKNLVA